MNIRSLFFRLLITSLFTPGVIHGKEGDESDLFRRTCGALAQKAEQAGCLAVSGNDNWLFLSSELHHLGAGCFWGEAATRVSCATKPENADPLPAILDFNAQLKKMNVELIVVPVPPKAVIYAEAIPGFTNKNTSVRLDRFHREFYALLRSKGVRVLDLTDCFLQNKNDPRGALYCRQDSHWSGNGCVLAARKIAEEVRPLLGASRTNIYKADWQTIEINGDLRSAFTNENTFRESLFVRKIGKSGSDSDEPVEPDASSSIILLGDSHNLVFHGGDDMLCRGAGLPDQLAFELGRPVELVAVRGSGATPARLNLMRRARQKDDYWTQKKCVIWCFAAREFTESDGWSKVPVVKVKHPAASRGATCSAVVALATQVESLRNPAKPRMPFIPVATYFAQRATKVKSHRAFWRRRVNLPKISE